MNRPPILNASLLLALVSTGAITSLAGCSTQDTGSVLSAGTSRIIWKSDGGGQIPLPANAPCNFDQTYDLDLHAGTLAWSFCTLSPGGNYIDPSAYNPVTGSRTLTSAEKTKATAAAEAVQISHETACRGADVEGRSLEVDGPSGSIIYGDDFYACFMNYQQYVFFEQLANLGDVLRGMATSSP